MPGQFFAPDRSRTALLLIDVINDFDFPAGRRLLRSALPAAKALAELKKRATAAGVPAIYVNDNFGRWRSDFRHQVAHCTRRDSLGRDVARLLKPRRDDYFVLKPMHSGFFATSLETLLQYLGTQRLVLSGFAGDICVVFTANDAYMRNYEVVVARDCIASETRLGNSYALTQMRRSLKAEILEGSEIRLD